MDERCVIEGRKARAANPRLADRAVILLLGFWLAVAPSGLGQDVPTEYQIKAAFVYNFVKFVGWPTQAFNGPSSPLVIGVLGKNVFGDNLEQAIYGKVINQHPLQFKACHSLTEATNCQVLFISASEKERFPEIFAALQGRSVLTVGETDSFCVAGGMINFTIVERKIRFQINAASARKAGLTISSDLLNLAEPFP